MGEGEGLAKFPLIILNQKYVLIDIAKYPLTSLVFTIYCSLYTIILLVKDIFSF